MDTKTDMKYLKYVGIAMALCIFIAILNLKRCDNLGACSDYKDFTQDSYSGKVFKKFIDDKNHRFRTILLSSAPRIVLTLDTSGFYSFVKPGDFVNKKKGVDYIEVLSNAKTYRFKVSFGHCDIK
jgi:hypothetical protein